MRFPIRVIPRLDVKGANLVKGIHLEGLRVLGDPGYYALKYADEGADELLFMDAVASLYGRNSLLDVIEKTARNVFIPLTVGGGIRSLDDISKALKSGADKVAISTAAVNDPKFVAAAANRFGSSTIVVHIDAKKNNSGTWNVWTENGREPTGLQVGSWARQVAELGCGEILVTSIDAEGTLQGFDRQLLSLVAREVKVPVLASGGAHSPSEIADTAQAVDLSAVCVASILHYRVAAELERNGYVFGSSGEFKVLAEKRDFAKVTPATISGIKQALTERNLKVRAASSWQER